MIRFLLFFSFIMSLISLSAQSDYYMRQARSYQREAEYYTRQAHGYDKEVAYYNRQAQGCVIRPIPVHFPGAIQSPNEA